jgi:hypothetical protein
VRAAIIVLAMAGSQGLAQDCMWVPLNATGPASQYYPPVAAWDSTRQRMVVVESRQNDLMLRTWEWDGTSWTLRAQGGPSNRCWHEIAYDQARARVVLFGGTAGFSPVPNDTWEWDGNVWALAASAGPPARYYHAMAYDAARSQVVLFGGNNPAFTQTWAWNGMTWFQVATSGPPFRQGAGMAYDATRQRTILFGGYINPNTAFNDLWEWDGAAWTQRFPSNSPSPRSDVAFAFDPLRSRFLMFSGALGNATGLPSETWEFDGLANSWQFRTGGGPPAGAGRPLAFDPVRGVGILVDQLGTTWQWSGNAALSAPWITQAPILPTGESRRQCHPSPLPRPGIRSFNTSGAAPASRW